MTIKILNLYAGIGGNRKLWDGDIEVTAVEWDEKIAKIYQDFFPKDKVIIADAHQYLLEHYKEFDFIWSSPPCPTHSDIRRMCVDIGRAEPKYPSMILYEEIIFLMQYCSSVKFVVENVIPYYEPLITPQIISRHCFWANFKISNKEYPSSGIKSGKIEYWEELTGFNLDNYTKVDKRTILRNCVNPELGLHIFNMAFKEKQEVLSI